MSEDPLLELSQLGTGFQPEFVIQRLAASAIHIKRVGLTPASIKRQHQLPQQPLTVGVQYDECLQLADHIPVVAEHLVGLDPVLQRGQSRFLQACDLARSERLVREIGERLAAPQPQGSTQQLARTRSVTVGERATSVGGHRLETVGVDLTRRRHKQIATATREERLFAERLAQMRDVPLQRLRRRCRWSLAPQLIDQAIARDRLPRRNSKIASSARCFGPPSTTRRSPSATSNGPKVRKASTSYSPEAQPYYHRAANRRVAPPPTSLPPPPTARPPARATVLPIRSIG